MCFKFVLPKDELAIAEEAASWVAMSLDDFSRAVLCTFDQGADPALRAAAHSQLGALKASPGGWSFCLQAFSASTEDRVKFWCLQTLVDVVKVQRRYEQLPEDQKRVIRAALSSWVQSRSGVQSDQAPYIMNKFAQLLVQVVRIDYPHAWPEVFPQLFAHLQNGPAAIDMFLRILDSIHEEVVSSEGGGYDSKVAQRVKDGMRSQCLPQMADAWLSILKLQGAPALVAMCLNTVHMYIPWIDISLVANRPFLELLLAFVHEPQLHEGACLCLSDIVAKRMEPQPKLEHLVQLSMVQLLGEAAGKGGEALMTAPFSTLASSLCLELLDCWDRLSMREPRRADHAALAAQASLHLQQCMPLLLSCLGAADMDVSACTMSFLHSYVGRLRKLLPSPDRLQDHAEHLQHMLLVMARKSVHPEGFAFESPDDDEDSFLGYRREISTLFKGVARVHPSLTQAFLLSTLQSTLDALETIHWSYVEVALWLAFQLGEGLPDALIREKGGVFQQLMTSLLNSSVSAHPHQAVQLLYFEVIVRYYRFFLAQPDYLAAGLRSFLDTCGLYNPRAAVCSRACYLLLRFVKQTLKGASASGFVEVMRTIMELLRAQPVDALEAPDAQLLSRILAEAAAPAAARAERISGERADATGTGSRVLLSEQDQLNLYEASGLMLGAGGLPVEQTAEMLTELLQPPLGQMERLCAVGRTLPSSAGSGGSGDALLEARAAAIARCVSVVAVVSKGFNNLDDARQTATATVSPRACFSHAMQLCFGGLIPFGEHAEVRQRTLMLLHRMVETLSEEIVSFLHPSLPQLLASADIKEVQEVVTLLNQLVLKWKGKIAAQISQLVASLTTAIFAHVAYLDSAIASSSSGALTAGETAKAGGQSEEVRERRGMLRSYYSFLHSLVHNELTGVLSEPHNSQHIGASLRLLQRGCLEGPDLQLQRQCFGILQRLVEAWGGSDAAFDDYIVKEVLPLCFSVLAQPHFRLSDPTSLPLLEGVATLQTAMLSKLGAHQLLVHLRDVQLPSLCCSAHFIAEYCRLLGEGDAKQLRDFIRQQLAAGGAACSHG